MTDAENPASPALAELLALWPRLTDETRQSLLWITRAKMAPDAAGSTTPAEVSIRP
ncbi:MAG: hypothetical protein ACRYG8_06020 [Janthinobacterium lividum]|jgi:hypothetical protein